MVKSGMVQQKRDRYYKTGQGQTAEAVVVKVTEGFGFVHPDEAEEDVFIPGRYLMGALPGDRVKISVRQGRGNLKEGEVLRILEEADYHFTGIFPGRGWAACGISGCTDERTDTGWQNRNRRCKRRG